MRFALLVIAILSVCVLVRAGTPIRTQILRSSDPEYRSSFLGARLPNRRGYSSFGVSRPFGSDSLFGFNFPRPRFLVWNNEDLKPWSRWSSCRSRSCRKIRFRQCIKKRKCPADYLVETQSCTDAVGCDPKAFTTTVTDFNGTCGERPDTKIQLRIIGGSQAKPHTWPWQGGIVLDRRDKSMQPTCGATLVGDRYLVTAAHCIAVSYWPDIMPRGRIFIPKHFSSSPLKVILGDHHVRVRDDPEQIREVEAIIAHPDFKLRTGSCENDLAVMKLKRPVTLGKAVNVACLPPEKLRLPTGTSCTALGWGVVKTAQPRRNSFLDWFKPRRLIRSPVLQEVKLPIVSHNQCRVVYPAYSLLQDRHLCAGVRGKDTCKGDSGGPLMCAIKTAEGKDRWFLYGITSFGSQAGCGKTYGVYTRVSSFTAWIKKAMTAMDAM